jgi:hypothetical protein
MNALNGHFEAIGGRRINAGIHPYCPAGIHVNRKATLFGAAKPR